MGRLPIIDNISNKLIKYFPNLKRKLLIADIHKKDVEYMDHLILMSVVMSLFIALISFMILNTYNIGTYWAILIFLIFLPLFFYYYIHIPDVYIYKKKKAIEYDIVFATKHIIIGVSSGIPLFDTLIGVSKGYGEVSKEFRKIVERVTFGEPITYVLRDSAEKTPSPAFKRILIQIANAVVSGADIGESLDAIISQISKEQMLKVKEYGQKMNPIIMFYLIIAVILPTLGITFIMILFSFVSKGVTFPLYYLILISIAIGLIQFLFLAYIESSRPQFALLTA